MRLGAVAAIVGGVAWVVKGGAILVTGDQPPVAFALGPPLFALALLGLYAALDRADPRAKAGAGAATFALALMFAFAVGRAVDPSLAPSGQEFTVLSGIQMAATLCLLGALVLLGLAGRRARDDAATPLSFWMGVLLVPGLLVGGTLSSDRRAPPRDPARALRDRLDRTRLRDVTHGGAKRRAKVIRLPGHRSLAPSRDSGLRRTRPVRFPRSDSRVGARLDYRSCL